jgi:hypothetical protein
VDGLLAGNDPLQALTALLGLGRGLTPSGDDFICGVLLARSRAGLEPLAWVEPLLSLARKRTTTLSSELIAAAASGSADERILEACDRCLDGSMPPAQILEKFLAYGSSSGLDLLVGFCTALASER